MTKMHMKLKHFEKFESRLGQSSMFCVVIIVFCLDKQLVFIIKLIRVTYLRWSENIHIKMFYTIKEI